MSDDRPDVVDEYEDIVQELRGFSYIIKESTGVAVVTMLEGAIFDDAADEIERLRGMGDRLINAINYLLGDAEPTEDLAELIEEWTISRV